MNLERAYMMLGALYSLLLLLGVIAMLMGGGSAMVVIQIAVGVLAVSGLWGYVLNKGVMNPRVWRPLALFLAAGAVVQAILLFVTSPSHTQITQLLIGIVFSALLISILYQYGNRDQDLWATQEEIEGGERLDELLARHGELDIDKEEEDRQATVHVSRIGDQYRANVIRQRDGNREQFEERFSCPSTLAFFIEKYTCITVDDIAVKYANADNQA
ncbi:sulfite exporter TauE/SafE family protein [Aidingimonas lacisalsi]|uniref:sulfite exporter TauE/SafE family protein n=1 Tax=Aidingimonas lacisalsi TaxID=2604086 RepID=UPI0011D20BBB|nr:sulfite exporter TauE/SafE family protein [Aidingimonas lacisalsi]